MRKILVTGGAGYKGTLLVEALLKEGHKVTILDNFMYGYEPVLDLVKEKNCSIVKRDIRNLSLGDVKDYDVIYHLAGVSSPPASEANPHSARTINVDGTRRLSGLLSRGQILVYASTTTFYGKSREARDEKSQIKPVSLYSKSKYEAERICMARKNSVALRFASIFGVSRRMRTDLMLNDFVFKALSERSLVLFDPASVRTFLHISDAVRAYLMVIRQPEKMVGEVFNVGSNDMNYSKRELADKIKKYVDFTAASSSMEDPEKRDSIISFDKIRALGFRAKVTIDDGIKELVKLYSFYRPFSYYQTI